MSLIVTIVMQVTSAIIFELISMDISGIIDVTMDIAEGNMYVAMTKEDISDNFQRSSG